MGQLARLEETEVTDTFETNLAKQMAGPRNCRSLQSNSLPTSKDELAEGALEASTKSSDTVTLTPAISLAPVPALGMPGLYMDVNLQRATKLALKLFMKGQKYGQKNFAFQNRAFKARNPNLYYRSIYME